MASLTLDNKETTATYFQSLGIPKLPSIQMANTIKHWIDHHGLEWCVTRLKDLKTQHILWETGSSKILVRSHKDLTPYGPFRNLWNRSLSLSNRIKALQIYTCVKSTRITSKQASKFLGGVNHQGSRSSRFLMEIPEVTRLIKKHMKPVKANAMYWIRSASRRAPTFKRGRIVTIPETELNFDSLIDDVYRSSFSGHVLLKKHKQVFLDMFPNMQSDHFDSLTDNPLIYEQRPGPATDAIVGKIGFIQERGMKLRAVANPYRLFQVVLEPLGNLCLSVLKELPWDCTFDQERGLAYAKKCLKNGRTVTCYDLSNATDKFPLFQQTDWLYSVICNAVTDLGPVYRRQISLFEDLSQCLWYAPNLKEFEANERQVIRWNVGQPLGLYPSFAIFALTHGALLRSIELECNKSDSFRVLGDDVIISDTLVAQRYHEIMTSVLGCEISESKSIVSDKLAEFAGKVISKDGTIDTTKWQGFSKSNPFGPLYVLGLKGLPFIPPKYRKVVSEMASLPAPFGLELNAQGYPLQARVDLLGDKLLPKVDTPITGYNQRYSDLHQEYTRFWTSVFTNDSDIAKAIPDTCQMSFIDQTKPDDVIHIEHYNAYATSLTRWKSHISYNVRKPDVPSNIRPEYKKTKVYPRLSQLFSLFRKWIDIKA